MTNPPSNDRAGVALVTGAGQRVGRAIAVGLAAQGYDVAVHYNSSAKGADETAQEIADLGRRAATLRCDLTMAETSGGLIERARDALGPVNVLINSASLFDKDNLHDLNTESWSRLIKVNLAAPIFLMQALARQDPLPAPAAIINLLDTQMASASPERFSYFCGKFGLEGATRLAASSLAPKRITVNAIAPGLVLPSGQSEETFQRRQQLTPLGEGLSTDDIVAGVHYLIGARHVTGHTLVIDSGQKLLGFGNMPAATER